MLDFSLNSQLNVDDLAKEYASKRRLHIPNILSEVSANKIATCLETQVPWGFAYNNGESQFLRAEEMQKMSAPDQQKLLKELYDRARTGFQYAYNCYPILDAYMNGWGQVPLLDRVLEFINSEEVLAFMRTLTGRPEIIKGDAQATRYGPGQFLKFHTDNVTEEFRVAAFVLNFTRDWDPDFGGYLQFYDKDWDIEEAFLPRFNALNIFTVPQNHAVSYVANYATKQRYAITGWFRYK
ncbi:MULTISPECIES: 2OG-Fe(II) oxygenase [Kordiimonas]|jgi:Rps23 Pro-64 3,4-dihydroxylase Tpa1-like proline 4-hydroxylase|uniref:2OG-Fe(II) oxygenase n=1 Tax=Kordiimonas TaxID=288021 RepID=UPI002579D3D2|nr:2OG-Fe(II) oxygenase family protein [Kordiimonas sp. UBA4487]